MFCNFTAFLFLAKQIFFKYFWVSLPLLSTLLIQCANCTAAVGLSEGKTCSGVFSEPL